MMKPPLTIEQLLPRIDWRAWFESFLASHGQPVSHEGRMLFADGWQHSTTDPAGPAWPPPADPEALRVLQCAYWRRRRVLVENDLRVVRAALERLESACASVDRPQDLKGWVFDVENSTDKWGRPTRKLATSFTSVLSQRDGLRMRVDLLEQELAQADGELLKLLQEAET